LYKETFYQKDVVVSKKYWNIDGSVKE